jgi:hypothetical protein
MWRVRVEGCGEVGASQPVLSVPRVDAGVAVAQRSDKQRLEGKSVGSGVVEDVAVEVGLEVEGEILNQQRVGRGLSPQGRARPYPVARR